MRIFLVSSEIPRHIAGRVCDAVGGIMADSRCVRSQSRAPDEEASITPNECGAQ